MKLAFLLVFHLLLLSVQVRNEQGRLLIRSCGLALVTPVVSGYSYLGAAFEFLLERYLLLYRAEVENRTLRRENADLKVELEQLRSLRDMVERTSRFDPVNELYLFDTRLVGVIWKSFPAFSRLLIVNGGTAIGIFKDAPVLSPEGVVGRIFSTTPVSAEVELLISAGAAAGAVLSESRLQAVVQGKGNGDLQLNFIPVSEQISIGEKLYTSGADRIYPKGLPIGEVIQCARGSVYWEVTVKPFVDFSRLEELMVVTSRGARNQREMEGF